MLSYFGLSLDFAAKEMWGEAIDTIQKFIQLSGGAPLGVSILALSYDAAGMKEGALKILERLDELSTDRYVGSFSRAPVWLGLGEKRRALEYLEKAYHISC